jgi:hypothetical protein
MLGRTCEVDSGTMRGVGQRLMILVVNAAL